MVVQIPLSKRDFKSCSWEKYFPRVSATLQGDIESIWLFDGFLFLNCGRSGGLIRWFDQVVW